MMKYVVGFSILGASGLAIAGLYTLIQKRKAELGAYYSLIKDGIIPDPEENKSSEPVEKFRDLTAAKPTEKLGNSANVDSEGESSEEQDKPDNLVESEGESSKNQDENDDHPLKFEMNI